LPTTAIDNLLAAGELRRGQSRTALARAIPSLIVHTTLFSLFILIAVRFLLIFPATNNCERWSMLETWRKTRGVTWRLWLAISIACVSGWLIPAFVLRTIGMSTHFTGTNLPAQSFAITSLIEDALAVVISVGCLEIFFCSWTVPKVYQPKEPEPRIVTIDAR
jgi:hypothetical protein